MKIILFILALMYSSVGAIPYQPHSTEQLKMLFNINKEGNKYYASTNLSALLAITEGLEIQPWNSQFLSIVSLIR